jgi:hypothetical protein
MDIKNIINRNLKNIPGKKTKRKIAVIYVDDYGSIRVKNILAREQLQKMGVPMDSNRFAKYDTLANSTDLNMLFEILTSVKDKNGNYACVTPFANIANPDFEKIRASGFETYFREPFTETLKRYGKEYDGVYELWKQGIRENIFFPAYHGTEHINVSQFMKALKQGHKSVHAAFDMESVCTPSFPDEAPVKNSTTTFYIEKASDNEQLKEDIKVGTKMFEELFGYRSKQFTPGAGIYSPGLHQVLAENGIKYINVGRYTAYPNGDGTFTKKFLFNGKENECGQKYIVRNCVFEPNGSTDINIVSRCLRDVEASFRWGAPAIISSHRVNFVGHFDENWRNNSLAQLKQLLHEIVKRNPDVEFMNGDALCQIVLSDK